MVYVHTAQRQKMIKPTYLASPFKVQAYKDITDEFYKLSTYGKW